MLIEPDFLQLQSKLRLSRSGEVQFVYDPIRRKDIALTPEELLRQLVLLYFLEIKKYPANRIRVEIGIDLNGLRKRCDLVVFDAEFKPWLLVECKSPKVPLTQATFEQAARYNLQLRAPHLVITNGLSTFCAQLDFETKAIEYQLDFPEYLAFTGV